jgi:hypothetical protein
MFIIQASGEIGNEESNKEVPFHSPFSISFEEVRTKHSLRHFSVACPINTFTTVIYFSFT